MRTLSAFRAFTKAEERMIRASMPKTAAADPTPLPAFAAPQFGEVVARRNGSRLVRPLTFKLAEVL